MLKLYFQFNFFKRKVPILFIIKNLELSWIFAVFPVVPGLCLCMYVSYPWAHCVAFSLHMCSMSPLISYSMHLWFPNYPLLKVPLLSVCFVCWSLNVYPFWMIKESLCVKSPCLLISLFCAPEKCDSIYAFYFNPYIISGAIWSLYE